MFNYLTAETLKQAALFNLNEDYSNQDDRYWTIHCAVAFTCPPYEEPTEGVGEAIQLINTVGKNYSTYRQTDKFMLLLFLAEFVASENELEKENKERKITEELKVNDTDRYS